MKKINSDFISHRTTVVPRKTGRASSQTFYCSPSSLSFFTTTLYSPQPAASPKRKFVHCLSRIIFLCSYIHVCTRTYVHVGGSRIAPISNPNVISNLSHRELETAAPTTSVVEAREISCLARVLSNDLGATRFSDSFPFEIIRSEDRIDRTIRLDWQTHQGVLHVCVRVRYLAPNSYSILRTARLAPTAWPPSTPIRLANLPSL